ncbi:hypothetical protein S245_020350 [Arachis hypogaea]
MFRIIPTTPRLDDKIATLTSLTSPSSDSVNSTNQFVLVRVPIQLRIRMMVKIFLKKKLFVELGEGVNDTLKLECSCKGELSLAHQQCAIKWFSIKRNRTCDVCKEVKNLPVTLLWLQIAVRGQHAKISQTRQGNFKVWPDAHFLVVLNMLAYFCFLDSADSADSIRILSEERRVVSMHSSDWQKVWRCWYRPWR